MELMAKCVENLTLSLTTTQGFTSPPLDILYYSLKYSLSVAAGGYRAGETMIRTLDCCETGSRCAPLQPHFDISLRLSVSPPCRVRQWRVMLALWIELGVA